MCPLSLAHERNDANDLNAMKYVLIMQIDFAWGIHKFQTPDIAMHEWNILLSSSPYK